MVMEVNKDFIGEKPNPLRCWFPLRCRIWGTLVANSFEETFGEVWPSLMLKKSRISWRPRTYQVQVSSLFLDIRIQYEGDCQWVTEHRTEDFWSGGDGVQGQEGPLRVGPPAHLWASGVLCRQPCNKPPSRLVGPLGLPSGRFRWAKKNAKCGDSYSELGFTPSGIQY